MKLVAEFDTDEDGEPIRAKGGGVDHYSIALRVVGAPEEVRRVRYRLHQTYRDPVREVSAAVREFEEPITSYGDYEVVVEFDAGGKHNRLVRKLSDALSDGHHDDASEAVRNAIEAIKRY